MAPFYPLYCRRSDGKTEVVSKSRRRELNQPTDDQLDQKPDRNGVSDFYRQVSPDEAKHLDWRRKLGGMLARELDWKDKNAQPGNETGYMLVAFPEHYRLYEHVKKTERDGKTEVKSKTHASGGNERQDAYLYGYPEGRRKRYRSPADFFPHLLWLCTDESGDPENCSCKLCSPDDAEDAEPRPVGRPRSKPESDAKAETGAGVAKQASVSTSAKVKQEPTAPAPLQRPQSAPLQLVPTPLPQPRTPDQQMDLRYNTFMFRPGELVWFQRGAAWGLGAIMRRWSSPTVPFNYAVQPLSHPMSHPSIIIKSSHYELRPWLAWSVPKYTNEGLNNMPEPPSYESADWQGMKQGRYGQGDLEVDGSILAAKGIDVSYTPLNSMQTSRIDANTTETYYNGIFLGAEKFWIGDPLRLAIGSGSDILVLHAIVEREQSAPAQPGRLQRSLYLVGDIYKQQTTSHNNIKIPTLASPSNNPQLPGRLTEDLTYRNNRSIPVRSTASYWKIVSVQSRIEPNDVRGRWYEASLLLPILQQAGFEEFARKGEIQEASMWMNARGDCLNSNRPPSLPKIPRLNIRKESRREAFGAAMASGAEIRDGMEPPLPDNVDPALGSMANQNSMEIDPKFESADANNDSDDILVAARPEEHHGGGLDEFMNLDEDGHSQVPGFGGEAEDQQGYF